MNPQIEFIKSKVETDKDFEKFRYELKKFADSFFSYMHLDCLFYITFSSPIDVHIYLN